jgi:tetratricopeptide (TPR) repeat protein
MPLLTNKKATARTPQVVTLVVDDSDSMQDPGEDGKSKAQVATESIQDMVITTQANTQGSKGYRFLLNIAKFGDVAAPIAEAQPPGDVDLDRLVFAGNSGWTNIAAALDWAAAALEKALAVCRALPAYDEAASPPPLVVVLSDGENTGPEVAEAANKLRSIQFKDGAVVVIACGIGMRPEHFTVMKTVASNPEYAVNIKPSRLAEFIAAVGATMREPDRDHITQFKDEWDAHMALGRTALREGRYAEAEPAFLSALGQVRDASDDRRAFSLSCLASLHASQGDWEQALPFCKEALDLLSRLGPSSALGDGLDAAERVAELLAIAEKPEGQALWMRIAGIRDGLGTANLAALGFRHYAEGRLREASEALEKAATAGGVGAAAALKGLATIKAETGGREAAEPFLERLAAELAQRFGARHPLAGRVIGQLRMSYVLGGKTDKIAQIDRQFRPR